MQWFAFRTLMHETFYAIKALQVSKRPTLGQAPKAAQRNDSNADSHKIEQSNPSNLKIITPLAKQMQNTTPCASSASLVGLTIGTHAGSVHAWHSCRTAATLHPGGPSEQCRRPKFVSREFVSSMIRQIDGRFTGWFLCLGWARSKSPAGPGLGGLRLI